MTDMPEKIWAGALQYYDCLAHGRWQEWVDDTTAQEDESAYIRDDLYEALKIEVTQVAQESLKRDMLLAQLKAKLLSLEERFIPRPIETAPKHCQILVSNEEWGRYKPAVWNFREDCFADNTSWWFKRRYYDATHWIPMPPLPRPSNSSNIRDKIR